MVSVISSWFCHSGLKKYFPFPIPLSLQLKSEWPLHHRRSPARPRTCPENRGLRSVCVAVFDPRRNAIYNPAPSRLLSNVDALNPVVALGRDVVHVLSVVKTFGCVGVKLRVGDKRFCG